RSSLFRALASAPPPPSSSAPVPPPAPIESTRPRPLIPAACPSPIPFLRSSRRPSGRTARRSLPSSLFPAAPVPGSVLPVSSISGCPLPSTPPSSDMPAPFPLRLPAPPPSRIFQPPTAFPAALPRPISLGPFPSHSIHTSSSPQPAQQSGSFLFPGPNSQSLSGCVRLFHAAAKSQTVPPGVSSRSAGHR